MLAIGGFVDLSVSGVDCRLLGQSAILNVALCWSLWIGCCALVFVGSLLRSPPSPKLPSWFPEIAGCLGPSSTSGVAPDVHPLWAAISLLKDYSVALGVTERPVPVD